MAKKPAAKRDTEKREVAKRPATKRAARASMCEHRVPPESHCHRCDG